MGILRNFSLARRCSTTELHPHLTRHKLRLVMEGLPAVALAKEGNNVHRFTARKVFVFLEPARPRAEVCRQSGWSVPARGRAGSIGLVGRFLGKGENS